MIEPLNIWRSILSPRVVQPSTSTSRNVQTSTPSTAPVSPSMNNMRSLTPRIVPVSTPVSTSTNNMRSLTPRIVPVSTSISSVYSAYGRPPASTWTVETLPRVRILKEEGACVICLEEWRNGDVAAELPCNHKYHFECVKKWLGTRATCPQCRYEMPLEGEEQVVKNVDADDDDDDYTDLYDSDSDE